MNIFILDQSQKKIAEYHSDIHVSKMLLEACQMLCAAHHVCGNNTDEEIPYKLAHQNHPCTKWVRESIMNYMWLLGLAHELYNEYKYRKGKDHGCGFTVDWLSRNLPKLPNIMLTPFVISINKEKFPGDYNGSPIHDYREYHRLHKQGMYRKQKDGTKKFYPYKWTKREKPEFMNI